MPLNQDAMKEREEKAEASKPGMKFNSGDNRVRVLPPNRDWLEKDIDRIDYMQWTHFNAGPEGSPPALCLRDEMAGGGRCPLCTLAKKIKGKLELERVYRSIVAKPQYWMNLFDVDHPEKGIQQRRLGPKVREPILQVAGDRSYGDILNPVTGRTFVINLAPGNPSNPNSFNQYTVAPEGAPSSVKDLLPADWGKQLVKLEAELLKPISFEDMQKIAGEVEDTVIADALEQAGKEVPPKNAGTKPADQDRTPADEGPPNTQQNTTQSMAPSDESTAEIAQSSEVKDVPPETTPAAADGNQKCFGEAYDPGSPKCMSCGTREACVKAYCGG